MADAVDIHHAFVSTKIDSEDASIVSSSEWNAPLIISGGADGQPLIRDSTKTSGAKWGQTTAVISVGIPNYVGPSPSPALGSLSVQLTSNATVLIMPTVSCLSSGGTTKYTITIRRNSVALNAFFLPTNDVHNALIMADSVSTPGTYTYDIIVTIATGTFASFNGYLSAIVLGVV